MYEVPARLVQTRRRKIHLNINVCRWSAANTQQVCYKHTGERLICIKMFTANTHLHINVSSMSAANTHLHINVSSSRSAANTHLHGKLFAADLQRICTRLAANTNSVFAASLQRTCSIYLQEEDFFSVRGVTGSIDEYCIFIEK